MDHAASPDRTLPVRSAGPWGDGFVEDNLIELARVRNWDELEADQFVRFCPQLAAIDGRIPAPLLRSLRGCVAALAFRLQRAGPLATRPSLLSMTTSEVEQVGQAWHSAMYGQPGPVTRALWLATGAAPSAAEADTDAADLLILDGFLARYQVDGLGSAAPMHTGAFAHLTGIHPAYLWSSALATVERDTAAGWLGVFSRGRAALMPAEVADYLWEAIRFENGGYEIRGLEQLSRQRRVLDLGTLRRTAARRRTGEAGVVARPRDHRSHLASAITRLVSPRLPWGQAKAYGAPR